MTNSNNEFQETRRCKNCIHYNAKPDTYVAQGFGECRLDSGMRNNGKFYYKDMRDIVIYNEQIPENDVLMYCDAERYFAQIYVGDNFGCIHFEQSGGKNEKMELDQNVKFTLRNVYRVIIPLKLPSLNEYIGACRNNKYGANTMKRQTQNDIMLFIGHLPEFQKPVRIKFIWQEINRRRDYDNICFAKKFILDALQNAGKIKNDNSKYVTGFIDEFTYGDTYCVKIEIEEM